MPRSRRRSTGPRPRDIELVRSVSIFSLIFVIAAACYGQTFYGTTDVKAFRAGRDKEFRTESTSPLKPEDLTGFKGLNYFPVRRSFRVAARFHRTPDEKYFQMPTSSGISKKFVQYGILKFRLSGKAFLQRVYRTDPETSAKFPEYADLLFIPFRDLTNRSNSYSGGRYIDIKVPTGSSVILDFNLAYSPNCAYGSDKYNCPIPPRENSLNVAIEAGEKRFEYSGYERSH